MSPRCPRLDKHLLRTLEDALLHRQDCPRDLHSHDEADYAQAMGWVVFQLRQRRQTPIPKRAPLTPLELWLDAHPGEPPP